MNKIVTKFIIISWKYPKSTMQFVLLVYILMCLAYLMSVQNICINCAWAPSLSTRPRLQYSVETCLGIYWRPSKNASNILDCGVLLVHSYDCWAERCNLPLSLCLMREWYATYLLTQKILIFQNQNIDSIGCGLLLFYCENKKKCNMFWLYSSWWWLFKIGKFSLLD